MRYILTVLALLALAIPASAAEKPIAKEDMDILRLTDLQAALAQERAEKMQLRLREAMLLLRLKQDAKNCTLDDRRSVWVCPDEGERHGE